MAMIFLSGSAVEYTSIRATATEFPMRIISARHCNSSQGPFRKKSTRRSTVLRRVSGSVIANKSSHHRYQSKKTIPHHEPLAAVGLQQIPLSMEER